MYISRRYVSSYLTHTFFFLKEECTEGEEMKQSKKRQTREQDEKERQKHGSASWPLAMTPPPLKPAVSPSTLRNQDGTQTNETAPE